MRKVHELINSCLHVAVKMPLTCLDRRKDINFSEVMQAVSLDDVMGAVTKDTKVQTAAANLVDAAAAATGAYWTAAPNVSPTPNQLCCCLPAVEQARARPYVNAVLSPLVFVNCLSKGSLSGSFLQHWQICLLSCIQGSVGIFP